NKITFCINDHLAEQIFLNIARKESRSDFHHLINVYFCVSEKMKKKISDFFYGYITKEQIDEMTFSLLYVRNVISAENKNILRIFTLQSINSDTKEVIEDPFGYKYRNYKFLNFVSILYYWNVDRKYIISLIPENVKLSPYCEWLLMFDFPEYDYNNFNLEWLLFSKKSDIFLNKFKTEPRIKKALEEYLAKEYNSEIGEIFMKHFYGN
ncbi:MAG: hypothetical protein ACFFG0_42470, partial [Candidatus Thorarchaeota archaeon]